MSRYNLHGKIAGLLVAGLLGNTLAILENGSSAIIIDIDKMRMTKLRNEFKKALK